MSIQKWRGPLLKMELVTTRIILVFVAIGLPLGLYMMVQLNDWNFCPAQDDYAGFWKVRKATAINGEQIPFIDSTLTILLPFDDEKAAKLSLPNMMIQPDAEQIKESYTMILSCLGDSMIINDSKYHYFSGAYSIDLDQHWERTDTFIMTSKQLVMKLVKVSHKSVFDDMVKSAQESSK